MLPDNLKPIHWNKTAIRAVREKYQESLESQIRNQLSTQCLREEDGRSERSIIKSTMISLLVELSVASWLKGKRNDLEFVSTDPYSYAWDVFALGRRIEVKSFNSSNFNINPKRRGGGCVDMTSFEKYDVAELLFACKTRFEDDIIIEPVFLMSRESYFNCRVASEQRPGTFYLQYDKESRDSNSCKVYK